MLKAGCVMVMAVLERDYKEVEIRRENAVARYSVSAGRSVRKQMIAYGMAADANAELLVLRGLYPDETRIIDEVLA